MINDLSNLKVTRNTITLRQIVLDKLRNAIISAQFKPGQRLVEREPVSYTHLTLPTNREV